MAGPWLTRRRLGVRTLRVGTEVPRDSPRDYRDGSTVAKEWQRPRLRPAAGGNHVAAAGARDGEPPATQPWHGWVS